MLIPSSSATKMLRFPLGGGQRSDKNAKIPTATRLPMILEILLLSIKLNPTQPRMKKRGADQEALLKLQGLASMKRLEKGSTENPRILRSEPGNPL